MKKLCVCQIFEKCLDLDRTFGKSLLLEAPQWRLIGNRFLREVLLRWGIQSTESGRSSFPISNVLFYLNGYFLHMR